MQTTLIDILLADGKISSADADAFKSELRTKRITEEDSLLSKFPEETVFEAKSKFYGVPRKSFDEDYQIPPDALTQIPEDAAKMYKFIPLARVDQDTIEQFEFLFGQYSSLHGEVKEALQDVEEEIADIDTLVGKKYLADDVAADAPVAKVISVIFKHAFEGRASDVHVEPLDKNTRVRFRVDGILHTSLLLPKAIHAAIVSRIKIITNLKIDESRVPQDGRFRTKISGSVIDFRVSSFPTINGEKIVMRLLDPYAGVKPLPDLGFVGQGLEAIQWAIERPYGMIPISSWWARFAIKKRPS